MSVANSSFSGVQALLPYVSYASVGALSASTLSSTNLTVANSPLVGTTLVGQFKPTATITAGQKFYLVDESGYAILVPSSSLSAIISVGVSFNALNPGGSTWASSISLGYSAPPSGVTAPFLVSTSTPSAVTAFALTVSSGGAPPLTAVLTTTLATVPVTAMALLISPEMAVVVADTTANPTLSVLTAMNTTANRYLSGSFSGTPGGTSSTASGSVTVYLTYLQFQ